MLSWRGGGSEGGERESAREQHARGPVYSRQRSLPGTMFFFCWLGCFFCSRVLIARHCRISAQGGSGRCDGLRCFCFPSSFHIHPLPSSAVFELGLVCLPVLPHTIAATRNESQLLIRILPSKWATLYRRRRLPPALAGVRRAARRVAPRSPYGLGLRLAPAVLCRSQVTFLLGVDAREKARLQKFTAECFFRSLSTRNSHARN